ncbi:MAG: hypothetical protein L7S55_07365 [Luminiphilus sp.]|nr:hypothetical protein [Luminiphilus sp.]
MGGQFLSMFRERLREGVAFFYALTNQPPTPTNTAPRASIQLPSLGMGHTAERIAQAVHIIRRIPSHKEREHIMQQLEEDGDFTAEGIEAVKREVG